MARLPLFALFVLLAPFLLACGPSRAERFDAGLILYRLGRSPLERSTIGGPLGAGGPKCRIEALQYHSRPGTLGR